MLVEEKEWKWMEPRDQNWDFPSLCFRRANQNKQSIRRPVGIRGHLTGNQEMGVKAKGNGGEVWNVWSLRHMQRRRQWKSNEWICLVWMGRDGKGIYIYMWGEGLRWWVLGRGRKGKGVEWTIKKILESSWADAVRNFWVEEFRL